MENPNYEYEQPPPYPYQQQPLEEQDWGDYAPYSQFSDEQQQQADQRWGTSVMGAPAEPSAHPDNESAATGTLGWSDRHESGSFHDQVLASQSHAAPSVSGQMPAESHSVQGSTSTASTGGSVGKFRARVSDYYNQANGVVSRLWGHLSTGPSMAGTAWGRVTAGTQVLTKWGFEGVFKSTFPTDADEKLKKTYACFLSTSTGPVAGTLYISTKRLAFCSDRALSYTPPGGQTAYSYYKVIIPIDKLGAVKPSVNHSRPNEKYIQIVTKDNYEFWFMGFVNYDKGVQSLQSVLSTENQPAGGS